MAGYKSRHHHRENRHRLGHAANRRAPVLPRQKEQRGNQRAGVRDADPPDEIHDVPAPHHRMIVAPDADAGEHLVKQARSEKSPWRKTRRAGRKSTTTAAFCLRRMRTACPSARRDSVLPSTTGARRNSAGGASFFNSSDWSRIQPLAVSFLASRLRCSYSSVLNGIMVIRHRGIRIADARQIRRARLRQQIAEDGIILRQTISISKPCCSGR